MDRSMTRRRFLMTTGAALASGRLTGRLIAASSPPTIAAFQNPNYYEAAAKAVEALGGIHRFVSKGSRVGILVNSVFSKPGTYAKPQIALAVIAMCHEAGAREIISLEDAPSSYWRRAELSKDHADMVRAIRSPRGEVEVPVRAGGRLRSVEVCRDLVECDVFINIPIFKDHEGTKFTGNLKNIMGATSGATNRSWHNSGALGGYYDDIPYLSDCIAEGNLVRRPTLCVGDATEVIVTNGPFGPGRISKPQIVVAGTDPVEVDSAGASLIGLDPTSILMLKRAAELGVGSFAQTPVIPLKG